MNIIKQQEIAQQQRNASRHSSMPFVMVSGIRYNLNVMKRAALARYLTLRGVANALKLDKSRASRILSGKFIPKRQETIQNICDALGVHPTILTELYTIMRQRVEVEEATS